MFCCGARSKKPKGRRGQTRSNPYKESKAGQAPMQLKRPEKPKRPKILNKPLKLDIKIKKLDIAERAQPPMGIAFADGPKNYIGFCRGFGPEIYTNGKRAYSCNKEGVNYSEAIFVQGKWLLFHKYLDVMKVSATSESMPELCFQHEKSSKEFRNFKLSKSGKSLIVNQGDASLSLVRIDVNGLAGKFIKIQDFSEFLIDFTSYIGNQGEEGIARIANDSKIKMHEVNSIGGQDFVVDHTIKTLEDRGETVFKIAACPNSKYFVVLMQTKYGVASRLLAFYFDGIKLTQKGELDISKQGLKRFSAMEFICNEDDKLAFTAVSPGKSGTALLTYMLTVETGIIEELVNLRKITTDIGSIGMLHRFENDIVGADSSGRKITFAYK